MALRLPGAEDLGGAPSGRSGKPIATYDTTAIGRGAAQLGAGIAAMGQGISAVAKRKDASVDQASRFETQRRFLEFSATEDDELNKAGQSAQPGAFGFREGYQQGYMERAKKFFASIPDDLKPEYDVKLFQAEDSLAGRALTFEREQRKSYYTNTVNDGLVKIENKLYENPSAFDANLAEGNEFISAIPDEDVSPIAKEDMRRQWKKKAQLAALNGLPPKARMEALGEGGDTDVVGVSGGREGAKALLRKKEGFRSSPYWDVNAHRVGYGSDTITRADGSVVRVTPDMTVSRADAERDLDRRVAEFERATIGQVGAREWGAMPPAAQSALLSVAYNYGSLPNSVVSAVKTGNIDATAASVEGLQGHNNGVNASRRKSEAALIRGQGGVIGTSEGHVDPRFSDMAWDERDKVIKGAETEQNQQQAEARVSAQFAIENALNNAPIAIQNTGQYLGAMPGQEQFITAYGDKAMQKFKEFEQAVETSRKAFEMQTMPATEIASLVKSAEPTSSGDDAALQQERYEVLAKAADATIKAREADPAGYARRVYPAMDAAWKQATGGDGNAYTSAVAMSIAAQEQLGITDIRPLPKDAASYTADRTKDENLGEAERFSSATTAIMSTNDPTQRRAIFEQLVAAGMPEITEGAFEALARGDEGAAQRLFQASMVDPSKLPGQAPHKPAEIEEAIQGQLMGDNQIGDIYYGISDGTAENYLRAQRDSKLLMNAVNVRLRSGADLEGAVSAAAKDLYGDVQVITGDGRFNAQILAPAGADPEPILDGLAAQLPDVRAQLTMALAVPADAPKADGTKAVLDAAASTYVENVMAEGFFRASGDGYVFIDPYQGTAVSDATGRPVVFKPSVMPAVPKPKQPSTMGTDYERKLLEDRARQSGQFQ